MFLTVLEAKITVEQFRRRETCSESSATLALASAAVSASSLNAEVITDRILDTGGYY